MNRYILICLGIFLFTMTSIAQTTVTGVVKDKNDLMPGVSVMLRGSKQGTITNANGVFSIGVKDPNNDVLVFSFLGMDSVAEPLNGRTSGIEIQMSESISQLDELVVVGYGVQKRRNLTGAVASVSGKVLENIPAPSLGEALAGKLAGVQITADDGSPDAEITIRVRGGTSLTGSNNPLILIDGFEAKSINDVSSTDIESVEVLKDASSTAIYGSRGANGVILVTTKRPQEGRVNVKLHAYTQTKTLSKHLGVLDAYDYVTMQYEGIYTKGSSSRAAITKKYGQPYEFYIYQGIKGTDWQDEIFGTNPVSKFYDLNISGGAQKTKYKFSGQFNEQPSVMYGNGMKQTNLSLDIETKINDHLTFNLKGRFLNKVVNGSGTDGISVIDVLRTAPTEGLDDHMTVPDDDTYFDPETLEEVARYNPRKVSSLTYRKATTRSFNSQLGITWNIAKNLSYQSAMGYEYRYLDKLSFWGLTTSTSNANGYLPVVQIYNEISPRWQWTNLLNYSFKLNDDHDFTLVAGQEIKSNEKYYATHNYRYFPETVSSSNVFDNLALGTAYSPSSKNETPDRTLSYFGRINYSYLSRYLFSATLRGDGSTKFAEGKRWGLFPAASVGWRISSEEFLKNNLMISNLKLRFNYGVSGNDDIGNDLYAQYYGVSRTNSAGWDETETYHYDFLNTTYLYNPAIKWETSYTSNLGLEFGLFKERLSGSLDVYSTVTKDLLVPTDIPGSTGYSKMESNMGQTSNKGIELALQGYVVENKDFKLNVNFNISFVRRKIDKLSSGETEWSSSSGWASSSLLNTDDYRAYVGSQKGLVYGFVNDGFYTMDDFEDYYTTNSWVLKTGVANSYNITGKPMPGFAKFKKLTDVDPNDADSYYISDADRQVIGNTNPKCSGGFGVNAFWKGFDMTLFFNFVYGFDVYNANKIRLNSYWSNDRNNLGAEVSMDKRWRYTDDMGNYIGNIPDEMAVRNKNATMWSPICFSKPVCMSWGIEDGSFLRLNTASLGYTFPDNLIKKIHMSKLRLYASGYNLYNFTSYSGYDPEVNLEKGLTPAVDYNVYPRSRTFTLGAQITF
jgi:TonB-dependent starch-binding outer membrane protein SusC